MSDRSLFGIPIHGDYNQYNPGFSKIQRPIDELQPFMQAMLDDPNVKSFGWIQYTPYFNDGEACVFSVGPVFVFPVNEETTPLSDEDDDYEDSYWDHEVWSYSSKYHEKSPQHHIDFSEVIQNGEFYVALLETFGDPVKVLIDNKTRQINMEFYDHD